MHPPFTRRTAYSEWCRGEWAEEKERRLGGGDSTPIFAKNMRGLGVQGREEDSSSCQSIKVGVTVPTSWSPACVTAESNLYHPSVFVAADGVVVGEGGGGGAASGGSAFVFSSQLMSHQRWEDLGRSRSIPWARSLNVSKSRAGLFHLLEWAKIFWARFTRALKGWNF